MAITSTSVNETAVNEKPEEGFPSTVKPPDDANDVDLLLARLERELVMRAPLISLYEDYYAGQHRLAFATSKFREAFASMLAAVNDNWMPLVVRATVERLRVQGFRAGPDIKDDDAWTIWLRNGLDEQADLAFSEAAKHGESYLLVWHDDLDTSLARITPEHPGQMAVLRAPGDRSRVIAALKRFWEPDAEMYYATLWTPDKIFRVKRGRKDQWWQERSDVPEETNQLGIVPVVPLVNDAQMLPIAPPQSLTAAPHYVPLDAHVGLGRSDLADVISTQDQINKLLCDLILASEFAAFRQRWATGLEVPRDKETNEPIEPFRSAIDRLWTSTSPDTKFGEFQPTDLANYTNAIVSRIQSIASRSRVPVHYFLGGMGNFPSGESLKSAETGLVAKCGDKQRGYGGGVKRSMSIAFEIEGQSRESFRSEVDWVTAESRTESEYVDALVKRLSIGVPCQQLWADYGYSPTQIADFKVMLREYADYGFTPPQIAPGPGQPATPQSQTEEPPEAPPEES